MNWFGGPVEFEDGKSSLAEELNKQSFTIDDLSEDSYYKKYGNTSLELKTEIENGIKDKFNEESEILDKVDWESPNRAHVLYAMLKKEFTYIAPLKPMGMGKFSNNEYVQYFGIDSSSDVGCKTIDILFYESEECFGIKLKTKEGEEVYLYKGADLNKSFSENFDELNKKTLSYDGRNQIMDGDIIKIPKIKLKESINYDELCGRTIKGLNGEYINQALQVIDFELDNYGGHVKSEALIETMKEALIVKGEKNMNIIFNDDFLLYLKEEDKNVPYFALKVVDTDVLVKAEYQPDEDGNLTMTNQISSIEN